MLWRFANSVIFTCLASVAVVLVATAWRGLDITDESLYLISARDPGDVVGSLSSAHLWTAPLFRAVGYDIGGFRVSGFAAVFAAGALLGTGLARFLGGCGQLPVGRAAHVGIAAFCTLGAMLYFGWTLRAPSYNLLNAAGITAATGATLLAGTCHARFWQKGWLMVGGFCLGVAFFAKFPSAIAALVLLAALSAWFQSVGARLVDPLMLVAGFALAAAAHFLLLQTPAQWASSWLRGFQLWQALDVAMGHGTFAKPLSELSNLAIAVVREFGVPILLCLLLAWRGPLGRERRWQTGACLVVSIVFFWKAVTHGFWRGGDAAFHRDFTIHAGVLVVGLCALVALHVARRSGNADLPPARVLVCAVLLGAIPFVATLGTGTPIYLSVLLAMGAWFGLLVTLLLALARRLGPAVLPVGLGLLAPIAALQTLSGYWLDPYRLHGGFADQNVSVVIGTPPVTIKVDAATAQFFRKMRELAREAKLEPGSDVIGVARLAGVVFALGARSPGMPWYFSGYPGSRPANDMILGYVEVTRRERAFLMVKGGDESAVPLQIAPGRAFPGGYLAIGSATWPATGESVTLYRPWPMVSRPP